MNRQKLKINISEVPIVDKVSRIVESICNVNVSENMYSGTDFLFRGDGLYIEEYIQNNSPEFRNVILEFCTKYIDDILLENEVSTSDGKYQIEIRKSHDTKNYLFCIESNDSNFYFEIRCDKIKKLMGQ